MKSTVINFQICIVLVLAFVLTSYCFADENPMDKADSAVANILFDYDYSEEYTSYMVNDDGFVDVTFAENIPNKLYSDILNKLNKHPDINGVLADTTGAYCKRF